MVGDTGGVNLSFALGVIALVGDEDRGETGFRQGGLRSRQQGATRQTENQQDYRSPVACGNSFMLSLFITS